MHTNCGAALACMHAAASDPRKANDKYGLTARDASLGRLAPLQPCRLYMHTSFVNLYEKHNMNGI